MCGIYLNVGNNKFAEFEKIKHRGPDGSQYLIKKYNGDKHIYYGFHRLSIINPQSGINQPFQIANLVVLCNGEIYNWTDLKYLVGRPNIKSDCEIIPYLYLHYGSNFATMIKALDGEFAIILHDLNKNIIYAARDFMGIRPLYYNLKNGELQIASELKAINGGRHILPRTIYSFGGNNSITEMATSTYWNFPISMQTADGNICSAMYNNNDTVHTANDKIVHNTILRDLYNIISTSVKSRMNTDRPLGCLLSGGLDSSIVAALAHKINPNIRCFVIGTANSPDVIAAKKVADWMSAQLTIIPFDMDDGIAAIKDVIWALETYDVTTVRASTPQYLMAKWISKNTDIKVILSGEGSDELFGGYLYSKLAPSAGHLYQDRKRLLNELYMFDCLRTDRTMAAFGLEVRVPFLQNDLVKYVLNLDPQLFMSKDVPEKNVLRQMAIKYELLPPEIAMRRKEAFSDAVDFSWKNYISKHCKNLSDNQIEKKYFAITSAISAVPYNDESFYYKQIFDCYYNSDILPHYWMPQWADANDPSATVLDVYRACET